MPNGNPYSGLPLLPPQSSARAAGLRYVADQGRGIRRRRAGAAFRYYAADGSLVHDAPVERWAPQAVRAGADIVLFTSPAHARRAVRALLPLARRGELDEHVARILRLRAALR